jgi:predicted nucleotidyltransferase
LGKTDLFVCVYGSYATNSHTPESDIDIFVAVKDRSMVDFEDLHNFVLSLHSKYNLRLDFEVPFRNKLLVSYDDINNANELRAFVQKGSSYLIPSIQKNPEFLASDEIRWRLILNALTSPHLCLSGNHDHYRLFKKDAEEAIFKLAQHLVSTQEPSLEDLLDVLLFKDDGAEGEMFLGYKRERPPVIEYLKSLISNRYVR